MTRPKNFRTVPCRLYHLPPGICSRGDNCHFIHCEEFKGQELPRDVMMRIRQESIQKYHLADQPSGYGMLGPALPPMPFPIAMLPAHQYPKPYEQSQSNGNFTTIVNLNYNCATEAKSEQSENPTE